MPKEDKEVNKDPEVKEPKKFIIYYEDQIYSGEGRKYRVPCGELKVDESTGTMKVPKFMPNSTFYVATQEEWDKM